MTRPLLICDCDEVLLHMVRHFGTWVGETHDIEFTLNGSDFTQAMRRRTDNSTLEREEMWGLIQGFFPAEMGRQTLVPHARESLLALSEVADIVILTNLQEECRLPRIEQLAAFGIDHRVECNQGGKGDPVARLVAEHGASVTVFVDDLAVHHDSVARHAPQVHRLHMISEPDLARHMPPAPAAHARIDDWPTAQGWIAARFAAGVHAEA
jgi:hypothetical protein